MQKSEMQCFSNDCHKLEVISSNIKFWSEAQNIAHDFTLLVLLEARHSCNCCKGKTRTEAVSICNKHMREEVNSNSWLIAAATDTILYPRDNSEYHPSGPW